MLGIIVLILLTPRQAWLERTHNASHALVEGGSTPVSIVLIPKVIEICSIGSYYSLKDQ